MEKAQNESLKGIGSLNETEVEEAANRLVKEGKMPDPADVANLMREAILKGSEEIRKTRSSEKQSDSQDSISFEDLGPGTISDDLREILLANNPNLTEEQIALAIRRS